MHFSQKFLAYILFVLLLVIGVNIISLKYYASTYFGQYLSSIKQETPDINFDLLQAFVNTKNLDEKTIDEYKLLIKDLTNLSNSLERFSKNPKAYSSPSIVDSLKDIGVSGNSIEQLLFVNALNSFFSKALNFSDLKRTPEWLFVWNVLKSMFVVNASLIFVILLLTYVWIKLSFRPIYSVIDNLSSIINKKEYKSIIYRKRDEFSRLIETINMLNMSLANQEKIRSDFLSDLSHEIKTPITAIKCYLEGIEDGVIALDEKNTQLLQKEIDRLIKITNSIMEYEKLEQQEVESIERQKVNIIEILDSVREEYSPLFYEKKQAVSFSDGKKFYLNIDQDKFTQLVHNIFSNFVKYAGEKTTMEVNFYHKKDFSILQFADNGKGVPESELPFLKEKFYQVEKSRSGGAEKGIGIGLSVIEKIVRLHGGECTIESAPGAGFALRLRFPK